MKKLLLIPIYILFTISCTGPENQVEIGPKFKYLKQEGDTLKFPTEEIVEYYNSELNYYELQTPISKSVSAKNYEIYFGFLASGTIDDYEKEVLNDKLLKIINDDYSIASNNYGKDRKIKRYLIKKDDLFIERAVFHSEKYSFVYVVNIISHDSLTIGKLYDSNFILENTIH